MKQVELITWVDITHQQGRPVDEDFPLIRYNSVGVVIREDEEKIVLCDTWPDEEVVVDDDGDLQQEGGRNRYASSVLAIPLGCVISRLKFVREDEVEDEEMEPPDPACCVRCDGSLEERQPGE